MSPDIWAQGLGLVHLGPVICLKPAVVWGTSIISVAVIRRVWVRELRGCGRGSKGSARDGWQVHRQSSLQAAQVDMGGETFLLAALQSRTHIPGWHSTSGQAFMATLVVDPVGSSWVICTAAVALCAEMVDMNYNFS